MSSLSARVDTLGRYLDIDGRRARLDALQARRLEPGFWDDPRDRGRRRAGHRRRKRLDRHLRRAAAPARRPRDAPRDAGRGGRRRPGCRDREGSGRARKGPRRARAARDARRPRRPPDGHPDHQRRRRRHRRPGLGRDAPADVHPLRRAPRIHADAPGIPGSRGSRHQERIPPCRGPLRLRLPPRRVGRPPARPHEPVRVGRQAPDLVRVGLRLPRDRRRHRGRHQPGRPRAPDVPLGRQGAART